MISRERSFHMSRPGVTLALKGFAKAKKEATGRGGGEEKEKR